MTDPAPQREAVLAALERLLAWPELLRSPQLGRFLSYIVQRRLEGNEQAIKAYSIAVDVFGRTADFDPQADPIVRVQARRLRALLDQYYRGPGAGDELQISLPVGRYIPEFTLMPGASGSAAEAEAQVAPIDRDRLSVKAVWVFLILIALGLAVILYMFTALRPNAFDAAGAFHAPTITVVEFQNLADDDTSPPQVAGLAIELLTDLDQFGIIDARYGGGETAIISSELPRSDYVLTGMVRPDGDFVQYSAILTDSGTGEVVWNDTLAFSRDSATRPDVLDAVSRSLSLKLGSPRGPLHSKARQFVSSGAVIERQATLYLCRVLFDLYRESRGASEARRAHDCFLILPEADRRSAEALAATATLMVAQAGVPGDSSSEAHYRAAAAQLQRALALDPLSSFVWEQQGHLDKTMGALARARGSYRSAVQLNPASVDALAAFALLLALTGNLAEAEAMARVAVEGSPAPPSWYMGVPALVALRDGDLEKALANSETFAQADPELGPILTIMAAQRAGDGAMVNRYLLQVLDVASFRAMGILPRLRERITDEVLLVSIESALVQAGISKAALEGSF